LKHLDLHEAIRAAGGLSSFCEAHPELARDGSRVVLVRSSSFKQLGRSQEIEIRREEEALQMHARVRHQAEEERHQVKLQTEMRLRQEAALQFEVRREETAQQREAARQQVETTRKETRDLLYQQAHVQLEQEQDSSQRRQSRLKREEASQKMLMQERLQLLFGVASTSQREKVSLTQKPMLLKPHGRDLHQNQSRSKQEEELLMQREARQQQLRLSREKDASQQQQLQLNALSISPLGALGSIISGGIPDPKCDTASMPFDALGAALRCLVGMP